MHTLEDKKLYERLIMSSYVRVLFYISEHKPLEETKTNIKEYPKGCANKAGVGGSIFQLQTDQ